MAYERLDKHKKFKNSPHLRKLSRIRQRRYHLKLLRLGFPQGQIPHSLVIAHRSSSNWHKRHWDKKLKADKKYRDKVRKKMGSSDDHSRYLYSRLYGRNSDRKARLSYVS